MSVVTKEEIEKVTDRETGPFPNGGFDYPRDFVLVGQLVAALVEERLMERVCSVCGKPPHDPTSRCPDAPDHHFAFEWSAITRSQYKADRETR